MGTTRDLYLAAPGIAVTAAGLRVCYCFGFWVEHLLALKKEIAVTVDVEVLLERFDELVLGHHTISIQILSSELRSESSKLMILNLTITINVKGTIDGIGKLHITQSLLGIFFEELIIGMTAEMEWAR